MTCAQAKEALRLLAIEAARLDPGREANRLSAYALLIEEQPDRCEDIHAELHAMAAWTQNPLLAGVLREAAKVVRDARPS
jgi:hypothetical protein